MSGEDDKNYYCTKLVNRGALHRLTLGITDAARDRQCVGPGLTCNYFAAKVGELLKIPYFRDVVYPNKPSDDIGGRNEGRRANEIYDFLTRAGRSSGSGWVKVDEVHAQDVANNGYFVIAAAHGLNSGDPGHLAVVAPVGLQPRAKSLQHHSGPWIRDGQTATTSVRASTRFAGNHIGPPMYVVWDPNRSLPRN